MEVVGLCGIIVYTCAASIRPVFYGISGYEEEIELFKADVNSQCRLKGVEIRGPCGWPLSANSGVSGGSGCGARPPTDAAHHSSPQQANSL
jgi:hypothetical protein